MKTMFGVLGALGLVCAAWGAGGAGEDAARAYNDFGFRLLAQSRESLQKTNFFLSPAGLAFALSMVQNGAQAETWRQIIATLGLQNVRQAELNAANKALLDHLSKLDPKITLEIANALWTGQGAAINKDFIDVNRRDYNAEVASGDFRDPATVKKINAWAAARTHDKIPELLQPPLDPLLRLIVLNAIYFKGDWQEQFDPKFTRDLPFTLASGQAVQHPRMVRGGHYAYYEEDGFQAVELPYAGGGASMFVFLPKGGLDVFLRNLTVKNFELWTSRMPSRQGTVELPRLKLENTYDLGGVLAAMGMPRAFTRRAELGGISDEPLQIGFVKQKTFVAVNEQGTEAAAATAVGARAMAARREEPPFRFVVDHPFFIAIRERQTGLFLFLGAIFDPR